MNKILLFVFLATLFAGCNSASKRAMATADAATRDFIRSQVRHTYNLIEIHNDKIIALNEISRDSIKLMLFENIDTTLMMVGIDKLKGDKLYERQKQIEEQLRTIRNRFE